MDTGSNKMHRHGSTLQVQNSYPKIQSPKNLKPSEVFFEALLIQAREGRARHGIPRFLLVFDRNKGRPPRKCTSLVLDQMAFLGVYCFTFLHVNLQP